MAWIVELLDDRVREELESLPDDMKARFRWIGRTHSKLRPRTCTRAAHQHLQGQLWEMRMKGRDGISRAIYVTAKGRRVVIVRVFIKKSQKTPKREMDIALSRAKEVQ